MRLKVILLSLTFLLFSAISTTQSILADTRDGHEYKIVKIGDDYWMKENLNFELDSSWCYDNKPINCETYGRLYTWDAAKEACPEGWRLPTNEDWERLITLFGLYNHEAKYVPVDKVRKAYYALILGGESGFDAKLGGMRIIDFRNNIIFLNLGDLSNYWSSSTEKAEYINYEGPYFYGFNHKYPEHPSLYKSGPSYFKSDSFSCRCIKN